MLAKLISNMPNGGFIKPHPSFFASKKIKQSLISAFKKVERNNIQLATNDIIIEIEMLYEKKFDWTTIIFKYILNYLDPHTSCKIILIK